LLGLLPHNPPRAPYAATQPPPQPNPNRRQLNTDPPPKKTRYPHVNDIWVAYLKQFVARYGGTKLERARDLFESAVADAPADKVGVWFWVCGCWACGCPRRAQREGQERENEGLGGGGSPTVPTAHPHPYPHPCTPPLSTTLPHPTQPMNQPTVNHPNPFQPTPTPTRPAPSTWSMRGWRSSTAWRGALWRSTPGGWRLVGWRGGWVACWWQFVSWAGDCGPFGQCGTHPLTTTPSHAPL
jgi:hypothetical protein